MAGRELAAPPCCDRPGLEIRRSGMKRRWIVIGWIGCAFGLASPGFSAEGQRPRSVLEGVRGLEKRVTFTETKIPLGEIVQKVAEETGVKLKAAKDVADEPVAVVVKEFPARELLEELADLLDYRWSRRGSADG